jgi:putative aldouronate transport system substrate-binding protein
MYALPLFGSDTYSNVLWARQDWIEKLKLPNPTSVQNVIQIAEAFAKNDPDGNGKDDTIGLLVGSNMGGAYGRLNDFFIGYHAFIEGRWLKDSAGNLVNSVIQPEVKTALAALADMYKRGIIDQEFTTRDDNKNSELIVSGKAGLFYGTPYTTLGIPNIEQMNPGIKLVAYPIPSVDSKPANFIITTPVYNYFVVSKKFAHPEAIIKLSNLGAKVASSPAGSYNPNLSVPHGYEYHHLNIFELDVPNVNSMRYRHINEAFETGNTSNLNATEGEFYNQMARYFSGKDYIPMDWALERVFAKEGSSFSVLVNHYEKNGLTSVDPYRGPPTETMTIRGGSQAALRDEVFTKIIIGELPVSAFDTFVQDWKREGGDKITEEVNAWYKANQ